LGSGHPVTGLEAFQPLFLAAEDTDELAVPIGKQVDAEEGFARQQGVTACAAVDRHEQGRRIGGHRHHPG